MSKQSLIHREMLQLFGEAYRAFGLNRQMGRIVALLMLSPEPLSLDEITKQLGLSKGPVSQLTRRLLERNIVRKVWNPGSRKDYFEIQPQSFSNAFGNFVDLIKHNVQIAKHLIDEIDRRETEHIAPEFYARLVEMQQFFGMMEQSFHTFLGDWAHTRIRLYDNELHADALHRKFSARLYSLQVSAQNTGIQLTPKKKRNTSPQVIVSEGVSPTSSKASSKTSSKASSKTSSKASSKTSSKASSKTSSTSTKVNTTLKNKQSVQSPSRKKKL
jgi:DNA-binding transcriptional regulator GbsR (MarR family)